jgi:phosphohistidine swiveling domain-containing protein
MASYYRWEDWDFDQERDLKRESVFVCAAGLGARVNTFLDFWCLAHVYTDAFAYGCDYFQTPTSRGPDWRVVDGRIYVAVVKTTEEEQREREPEFRKRIMPWIEDYGKEYYKLAEVLDKKAESIKAVNPEKATDAELKRLFQDWLEYYNLSAQIHFIWIYAYCNIYALFEDVCKELLGIDKHSRQFNDLMAGFDHKVLQTDREQYRLGQLAKEFGFEPLFQSVTDNDQLLKKIAEDGTKGRQWLDELKRFVQEYGWRTGANWDLSTPSWVEDPGRALPAIRMFMSQPTFLADESHRSQAAAREEAEKKVLSKVPDAQKEMFVKLMKSAQWAGRTGEEHVFYCENYGNALGRYILKEISRRFLKAGVIEDPLDTYYLLPAEIDIRIIPKFSVGNIAKIRRKQFEEFSAADFPPFIGDPTQIGPMLMADPMIAATVAPNPQVRPELKGDLYGTIASPGFAEGIARVIRNENEFAMFQKGEILVTMETSSTWTPLFGMAKAVVTDGGGALSHAAIVGRDYGVPVVAGTVEGTRKIKTGMKLRVDGDQGVVYILEDVKS